MPFKSKAQQKFMFAQHPRIAKRWAQHTDNIKSLPDKVKGAPMDKQATICVCPGIHIKRANVGQVPWEGGNLNLASPQTVTALAATSSLALGAGMGGGYGLAKLLSPSTMSIENLQREELADRYDLAISEIGKRMALNKLRLDKSRVK